MKEIRSLNLYYNNKFQPGSLIVNSGQPLIGLSFDRLISPYLHYGILFNPTSLISLSINASFADSDTILVSGENIKSVSLSFMFNSSVPVSASGEVFWESYSYTHRFNGLISNVIINIFPIDPTKRMTINAIYVGDHITVPNMESAPEIGDNLFSSMERAFDGFALGYERVILEEISANFVRVNNLTLRKIRNEYVLKVGNVIPHWVDLYPEANERFSPVWATLNTNQITYEKRTENEFFWNFTLSWTEAK